MVLPHGVRGGVGTSPKYRRVAHVAPPTIPRWENLANPEPLTTNPLKRLVARDKPFFYSSSIFNWSGVVQNVNSGFRSTIQLVCHSLAMSRTTRCLWSLMIMALSMFFSSL